MECVKVISIELCKNVKFYLYIQEFMGKIPYMYIYIVFLNAEIHIFSSMKQIALGKRRGIENKPCFYGYSYVVLCPLPS